MLQDRFRITRAKAKRAKSIVEIGSAENAMFPGWPNVTHVDIDKYDYPNFAQADAHDLPFEDKQFELAVLCEILEHVQDPVQVLKEAQRVAERIWITVPLPEEWIVEHRPFENTDQLQKRLGLDLRSAIRKDNPAVREIAGDKTGDYSYKFHIRWYTENTFGNDIMAAGLQTPKIGKIAYNGWSFLTCEAPWRLQIALLSTPYITTPPANYGGLERVVADLAAALTELGHEVTVYAAKGSKPIHDYEVVECIEPLGNFGKDYAKVNWYALEKQMYYSCMEQLKDFEVVHGHNWFGFEAMLRKHVFHTHHGGISWQSYPTNMTFIAISKFMQDYSNKYFRSNSAEFAYNGIDLGSYPYESQKGDRLVFVGRFVDYKGPHVAIEVAKAAGLGLDLVGGPHDPTYFEQLRRLADGGDIEFHIDAGHEKKVELLQNAKALLMPSRFNEPFGLTAVESLSCGTPVIAFNDGALQEILTPDAGILCSTGADMLKALDSVERIKPAECHERAMLFSRENMARKYLEIYGRHNTAP